MKSITKEATWVHEDKDGEADDIGEFKFNYDVRRAESYDDAIVLCGTEERLFDLLEQKLSTVINPFKKKFNEAADEAGARLVIKQAQDAAAEADLTTTRGTGVNAKAAKWDTTQEALAAAGDNMDAKLAVLRAAGFNI
jgi:hypothetical protein